MYQVLNIKNIPNKFGRDELEKIFSCDKGNITNVKVVGSYGFITFDKKEALQYWLEKKFVKCEDGTILDLGIGEKNKTLHVKLRDNSKIRIKDIKNFLNLAPMSSLETSIDGINKNEDTDDESNKETIITFESRPIAEDAQEYLRGHYDLDLEIAWMDRDSYPIAIHMSFNRTSSNTADINFFNKEIIEEYLYLLQDEDDDDVEEKNEKKKEKKKEKIKMFVDFPREQGLYRGYGTIQYDKTYSGMKECKRIIEKHPLITVGTVTIKLTPHHRLIPTFSASSTSPKSSTSISPSAPPFGIQNFSHSNSPPYSLNIPQNQLFIYPYPNFSRTVSNLSPSAQPFAPLSCPFSTQIFQEIELNNSKEGLIGDCLYSPSFPSPQ
jgi:hypothetical protein